MIHTPYINDSVGDGRGENHIAGFVTPRLHSCLRIQSIDVMIPASYVDDSVGDGRTGLYKSSGHIAPHFLPGTRIEGIDVMIITPYVKQSRW